MLGVADYGPSTYGEALAPVYDEWTAGMDPGPAVEFLRRLVPAGGTALELGIGTGRVALPLARSGVEVSGIDASPAMIARLRSKPGAERLDVAMGDFADVGVAGAFDLVFVVFSTLFALPSQAEQLRCLCNVAAHLVPGGHLVVEAFVPDVRRFTDGQSVRLVEFTDQGPRLDVGRHDPVEQRIDAAHLLLGPNGTVTYPVHVRYAWPAELDAMALVAGLEPVSRYGGFSGEPFTAASSSHVSVYRRGAEPSGE